MFSKIISVENQIVEARVKIFESIPADLREAWTKSVNVQRTPLGDINFFPGVPAKIIYGGTKSRNPFEFRHLDPTFQVTPDKTMAQMYKYATALWHFSNPLGDPFGPGTRHTAWAHEGPMVGAKLQLLALFQFLGHFGPAMNHWCFHGSDLAPDADVSILEADKRLDEMVALALELQKLYGVELGWGTGDKFRREMFADGAATSNDFDVLEQAAAIDYRAALATIKLGGKGFVFWGGREGIVEILNTLQGKEKENLAMYLRKVAEFMRSQGYEGEFFIEPKKREPTTERQYDADVESCIGFLKQHGLDKLGFKINIENNHACLAGQHPAQQMAAAAAEGMWGSQDANFGPGHVGYDVDQFLTNLDEATQCALVLLRQNGFKDGVTNFDAKVDRTTHDWQDLFFAHIGSMDAYAYAMKVAMYMIKHTPYLDMMEERYASLNSPRALSFTKGELDLANLRQNAIVTGKPTLTGGTVNRVRNELMYAISDPEVHNVQTLTPAEMQRMARLGF